MHSAVAVGRLTADASHRVQLAETLSASAALDRAAVRLVAGVTSAPGPAGAVGAAAGTGRQQTYPMTFEMHRSLTRLREILRGARSRQRRMGELVGRLEHAAALREANALLDVSRQAWKTARHAYDLSTVQRCRASSLGGGMRGRTRIFGMSPGLVVALCGVLLVLVVAGFTYGVARFTQPESVARKPKRTMGMGFMSANKAKVN